MSADELRVRLSAMLRRRRERGAYRRAAGTDGATFAGVPAFDRVLLQTAARLVLGTVGAELDALEEQSPEQHSRWAGRIEEAAERILHGRPAMLGHAFDLRGKIDWHADPRTGHRFPRVFYSDVPLHQDVDDDVDVKYVWELGRQQYLVELARGWLFHGRGECAERVREVILNWIEENPLYEGVHWTSGLEVAMRSISWIWSLATLADWEGWNDGDLSRIGRSLGEHAEYLRAHFSFYSSPYNHLVGEATALLLIADVLRENPRASEWERGARNVLSEHGPRQFYADGFCVEQAMGYHYYTLGFLTLAIIAARNQGQPLVEVEEAVRRAYRAGMHFRQPNGRWPAIGDVDSARSIPVQPDDFWNFDGLCSVAAVLFEDPQLKRPGMQPGEELYWLLGSEGLEKWDRLETSSAETFAVLEDSGYVVGRSGGDWLCFDAGPVAHGLHADGTSSTAHGHLDTLQVLYCRDSEPVLVDAGMPFYFGDREWVRHFRSPAAHNTLEIEGLPLAKDAGRLAWSHVRPRPELHASDENGVWTAWARLTWENGATIERHVVCRPGVGLWIADSITLDRPRMVRWYWQVGSHREACEGERSDGIMARGDGLVFGSWSDKAKAALAAELKLAEADSPAGWRGEAYGSLRGGRGICEELSSAGEVLKVSFIGSRIHSFSFTLAGRTIEHGEDCDDLGETTSIESGSAVWRFGDVPDCASLNEYGSMHNGERMAVSASSV